MKPANPKGPAHPIARHIIVGTAGHIDHGKTALVYALTGTDTDRLPEERQRGITIDLGFASLELESALGERLQVSLIDVPGHHAFVRNMLAGAAGIDCAMLVIAADEGVKAQTREHLDICSLLGIERGIVVITKCDAVDRERLNLVREEIRRFVQHSFLEDAPILAISALRGDGIPELKRELARMASAVPARGRGLVPRLPIDRSFTMRGFGTVVTGTLQSESMRVGDSLQQHPSRRLLRVRGMQVHGSAQQVVNAPCRVALNMAGVEVAEIGRGSMLTTPETVAGSHTVDVELSMLADAPVLKHGARVRVHAFTSDTAARVLLFDQKTTAEHGSNLARLRLAEPLVLIPGDRIVLRQASPAATIGGAVVLDTDARPGVRKAIALEWLRKLSSPDPAQRLLARISRAGTNGVTLKTLRAQTGLQMDALAELLLPAVESCEICSFNTRDGYITQPALTQVLKDCEQQILREGALPRAELRSRTGLNISVFELVLDRLVRGQFEIAGEVVRRRGSGDLIPAAKRNQMEAVDAIYAAAGLAAPLLRDVVQQLGMTAAAIREIMTLLLRAKRLIRMGSDDAFVHSAALEKLYGEMRAHRGESFDVGRFKTLTGLTRKHAIPLLEHLDQARVTRNNGGIRVVL